MTPLHGIACFYDVGFGARAVSRKMPIYFILIYFDNFEFILTIFYNVDNFLPFFCFANF